LEKKRNYENQKKVKGDTTYAGPQKKGRGLKSRTKKRGGQSSIVQGINEKRRIKVGKNGEFIDLILPF